MDPTVVAQQPTVWAEKFLTQYGPAIQAGGFLGWLVSGIAALIAAVAFLVLVPSLRRAALEYARMVESQIGPRPVAAAEVDAADSFSADKADDVEVEKFVD